MNNFNLPIEIIDNIIEYLVPNKINSDDSRYKMIARLPKRMFDIDGVFFSVRIMYNEQYYGIFTIFYNIKKDCIEIVKHGISGSYTICYALDNIESIPKYKKNYSIEDKYNGAMYEGALEDDKRHGQGKLTYANGDVYKGALEDDKRHGQGKLTYANGTMYKGTWKDDKRHGQGKLTYANGTMYKGTWKDDKSNCYNSLIKNKNFDTNQVSVCKRKLDMDDC